MSLTKHASFDVLSAQIAASDSSTLRTAHRAEFNHPVREGYLYVRSRAISSRCNDNFDEFPAEEIKASYKTFIGKPVFVNHHNANHRRARGVVIDAALHEDVNSDGSPDTWAEVLMEVDAIRFPKLAEAIVKGHIERTSMGTDVAYSICSACGNKASSPLDYCQHIPKMKGQRIYRTTASGGKEGILVRELCYGLGFFENSLLVEEPADPTAHFVGGVDTSGVPELASLSATAKTASRKVAAHATEFGPIKEGNPTRCYELAGNRVIGDSSRTLFHGTIQNFDLPPLFHTWVVEPDGGIWESSTGTVYDPAAFKRLFNPVPHHSYSGEETRVHALGSGHWGPWEGPNRAASKSKAKDKSVSPSETDDPDRYEGTSIKQDSKGYYVHTHRARSKSYPSPEQIPDSDIAQIESSGSRRTASRKTAAALPDTIGGEPAVYIKETSHRANDDLRRAGLDLGKNDYWGSFTSKGVYVVAQSRWDKMYASLNTFGRFDKDRADSLRYKRKPNGDYTTMGRMMGSRTAAPAPITLDRGTRTTAPGDVDTLRNEQCPVCGERESYDGSTCQVCSFEAPPREFTDPDLSKARDVDLRQDDEDENPERLVCDHCDAVYSGRTKVAFVLDRKPDDEDDDDSDDGSDDDEDGDDEDTQPEAGETCPSCGKGTLSVEGGDDPESDDDDFAPAAKDEDADDPADDSGDGFEPAESEDEDESDDDSEDNEDFDPDDDPDDDSEDDSDDDDEDDDEDDDKDGKLPPWLKKKKKSAVASTGDRQGRNHDEGTEVVMRPALAALAEQQKQIDALNSALTTIAKAAGIENDPRIATLSPRRKTASATWDESDGNYTADVGGFRLYVNPNGDGTYEWEVEDAMSGRVMHSEVEDSLDDAQIAAENEADAWVGHFAGSRRQAKDDNPGVPDGWATSNDGSESANETSDGARKPDAEDDPSSIGASPLTDVAADATADVNAAGGVMDAPLSLEDQDVTKEVSGTDDLGEGPRGQAGSGRTETDVRVGDPTNPQKAFDDGGFLSTGSSRAIAAMRLARLQIEAGIADGDDLTLGDKIARSNVTDDSIQDQITTLDKVAKAAGSTQERRTVARNLVPRAARTANRSVPSLSTEAFAAPQPQMTSSVNSDEVAFE